LKNVLALDLGASSGRGILGRYDGDRLQMEEIHRFHTGSGCLQGTLYWDILQIMEDVKRSVVRARQAASGELASLAVDTWGVDYAYLDSNGDLLSNPIHYRDVRNTRMYEQIFRDIPREMVYQETGIQFLPLNTLVQLYADQQMRPHIPEAASDLLLMPDLINYFLTGRKLCEETIASTTQLYNPVERRWSASVFQQLGLPLEKMAEVQAAPAYVGDIQADVAEEMQLPAPLPVCLIGSHDTASAVAAVPFDSEDGAAYISSGTWSLLGIELRNPVINDRARQANLTNEIGVEGRIRFLKNITGLWMLEQCREIWRDHGEDVSYETLNQQAREEESAPFCLDMDAARFLHPENMLEKIAGYCRETGQPVPKTIGQYVLGIYESLASSYNQHLSNLESVVGEKLTKIHIVGGGSRNELLCQMTADITGRDVLAGPAEATAIGNILVQLMAAGELNGLAEARELVRRSMQPQHYAPQSR